MKSLLRRISLTRVLLYLFLDRVLHGRYSYCGRIPPLPVTIFLYLHTVSIFLFFERLVNCERIHSLLDARI